MLINTLNTWFWRSNLGIEQTFMICSSKYNRKMYRAVSPKPRLFCFVLFWLQSFIVYVLIPRDQDKKNNCDFSTCSKHKGQRFRGTRVLTRKVGTTLTLPGLFFSFTTGETNRTNAATLCSVDSKSFVGTGLKWGILLFFSRKNILCHVYI